MRLAVAFMQSQLGLDSDHIAELASQVVNGELACEEAPQAEQWVEAAGVSSAVWRLA